MFNPLSDEPVLFEQDWDDSDIDQICRWAVCVYDPASPLIRGERDLSKRRLAACDLLNISEDLISDKIKLVSEVVFTYLKMVKSMEWAAICSMEYKVWEAFRLIMQPISSDKSDKEQLEAAQKKEMLTNGIDESMKKYNNYYRDFFETDKEIEIQIRKKRTSPEIV